MEAGWDGMWWQLQLCEQLSGRRKTCYSAQGECAVVVQIGGSEFLRRFKGANWIRGFQHEGEQPDTWTPFRTLGCEGCGENGCHSCVNSIEFHLVEYIQANPYLPPTVQRLRVKGFVLPVKWGPTFREESKTLPKGDNEQTCMLPLLQLVRRK